MIEFADRVEPLGILTPGSDEWRAARAAGIGGSEVASVLGVQAPWAPSPFTLWHIKAGTIDASAADSDPMYWGRVLEPVIVAEYARRHEDVTVQHIGDRMYRHRDRPYQLVSPDALVWDGRTRILEAKAPGRADGWFGPDREPIVPLYYELQGRWYLDATGLEECIVAALVAGNQWIERTVREDLIEQRDTRAAVEAFIASVKAGTPPRIDDSASTYETLTELGAGGNDDTVEIAPDVAREYLAALDAQTDASMRAQGAINRLLAAMGDAKRARCQRFTLATRRVDGALVAARNRPRPSQIKATP